jgi:hypothetical protein
MYTYTTIYHYYHHLMYIHIYQYLSLIYISLFYISLYINYSSLSLSHTYLHIYSILIVNPYSVNNIKITDITYYSTDYTLHTLIYIHLLQWRTHFNMLVYLILILFILCHSKLYSSIIYLTLWLSCIHWTYSYYSVQLLIMLLCIIITVYIYLLFIYLCV